MEKEYLQEAILKLKYDFNKTCLFGIMSLLLASIIGRQKVEYAVWLALNGLIFILIMAMFIFSKRFFSSLRQLNAFYKSETKNESGIKMCWDKQKKRIFGRWLEGMGIGVLSGALVSISIVQLTYWYWLVIGVGTTMFGAYLLENNS